MENWVDIESLGDLDLSDCEIMHIWEEHIEPICLEKEARTKLMNFILDPNGKDGESLHYVVLEGNCVLVTITRDIYHIGDENDPLFLFMTVEYRMSGNGKMEYITSGFDQTNESLQMIKENVSYGPRAIEDPSHEALEFLMSVFDDVGTINWRMLKGESFVISSNLSVEELRAAMKSIATRGANLQDLTKQDILSNCNGLPLPEKMIE